MTTVVRLERWTTAKEAAFARELARHDPSFGTQVFPVADGVAVLGGPGLFVNRALGVGIDAEPSAAELDEFEQRGDLVGVPAVIEVTDVTRPNVVQELGRRGYRPGRQTSVVARPISRADHATTNDPTILIDGVGDDDLAVWKDVAARGWGHERADRRRASDLFADVSHAIEQPGLVLARSAGDGHPLGCAVLHVADGVASLGGMTTLEPERGKGVQSALVRHRLRLAAEMGCDLVTSSAAPGSISERNLFRHDFIVSHTKVDFTREL